MKKILIFGLGFQSEKHINYFYEQGYEIIGVSKSGKNKRSIQNISQIYSFFEFQNIGKDIYGDIEFIIISVYPYNEQSKVIQYLLSINIKNNIIIEKPVTKDLILLQTLIKKENITFFIDEVLFTKVFTKEKNGEIIIESLGNDIDILEHAYSIFLLHENFNKLLDQIKLVNISNIKNLGIEDLFFKVQYSDINFTCIKGNYFIGDRLIAKNIFIQSIDFLIKNMFGNNELNKLYKNNFYLLEKYLIKNIK